MPFSRQEEKNHHFILQSGHARSLPYYVPMLELPVQFTAPFYPFMVTRMAFLGAFIGVKEQYVS
jgi:hypothetical protein